MLGRWIGRGFLCAATAAAHLGAAPAATAADGLAKVAVVQNQVEAKKASADGWAPSTRDQALFAHDRIRTGAASRAALLYSDQTLHRMGEKSELEILPPNGTSGSGLLNVVTGRHYFATRTPKDFGKVQTPTVTAAIKGTEFAVDVAEDGTTTITMIEGTVEASNPYGSVTVVKGEQAVAAPGSAPQKRIVVHPRDAVAWALHYPAVVGGADAARLAGMGTTGEGLNRAATLLSQGQVEEARPLVAAGGRDPVALALASVIAVAGNAREDARRLADEAVAAGPDSASAALAASFAAQAGFDLAAASSQAERAARLDPDNPEAQARVAELRMAAGDLDGAREAAERAVRRDAKSPRAHSVLGFVALAQYKADEALDEFTRAVDADPSFAMAWLGRGLATIRQGNLEAGREMMQTAVTLDPDDAILRSYLGKAYQEEHRTGPAAKELAAAKDLDPNDPTPWLYSSLLMQDENRPVEALGELQGAIERNDRRAVYRSRLLLDEDRAVRSADLARTYNDLGFDQLGVATARRSADEDHANYSSHLFLSGTYRALPGYAGAFLSEVLQARVYQPVGVNAVRPDVIGQAASFNEYSALFDRPRLRVAAEGVYGETETDLTGLVDPSTPCFTPSGTIPCALDSSNADRERVTVGMHRDRWAVAGAVWRLADDGFRANTDSESTTYRAFAQVAPTWKDTVQVNFISGQRITGDLPPRQFPTVLNLERFDTRETNVGLAWHRRFSPAMDIAVSAIGNETRTKGAVLGGDPVAELTARGPQLEGQWVYRQSRATWLAGAGIYDGTLKLQSLTTSVEQEGDDVYRNAYAYATFRNLARFDLTGGLAFEDVDHVSGLLPPRDSFQVPTTVSVSDSQVSPKVGVSFQAGSSTVLRGTAYGHLASGIGRVQSLEPTQVAGFNQIFEDPGGTQSWNYGLGIDQSFGKRFFAGGFYMWRRMEVPEASCATPDDFNNCRGQEASTVVDQDSDADVASAYVNGTLGKRLAASVDWAWEDRIYTSVAGGQFAAFQDRVKTSRVRPQMRMFLPWGLYASLAATRYDQSVRQDDDLSTPGTTTQHAAFWVQDAELGYRLPRRYGTVAVQAQNLGDREFSFFDRTIQDDVIPARRVLLKATFTY